jgi:hypothetical protein
MAGAAIAMLALFLAGVAFAVIAVVAVAVRREDRHFSLSKGPGGPSERVRRVIGAGRRDLDMRLLPQAEQARGDAGPAI